LWTGNEQERAALLKQLREGSQESERVAFMVGEGRLYRALYGQEVEYAAAGGRADAAFKMLDLLAQGHREGRDAAGVAWCALCRGDILAAPPPLGRPALFGYVIKDLMTNTTTEAEPSRFDRSGIDLAGARAAYEEAHRLYTEAGAPRGVGLATARLAYLDAVDDARGWAHAARRYAEAEAIFNATGDRKNEWLARAGHLWARLGEGASGLAAAARPLAEEMKAGGALTWGLSTGLAFAYAGREALAVRGDVDAAVRGARVAEVFFEVFDSPLRRAQVCFDRADTWRAFEAIENALLEWDAALGWLAQAARQPQSDPDTIRMHGVQLTTSMVMLHAERVDPEGLERARERARTFVVGVPIVADEEIMRLLQGASGTPPGSARREAILEELGQKFIPYALHTFARMIEEQGAVGAPAARGLRAMEGACEERAGQFFAEALAAAEGMPERDLQRAAIFAAWLRYDDARAALEQYLAAGLPHSFGLLCEIPKVFTAEEAPAPVEDFSRKMQVFFRRLAANVLMQVGGWEDARRQYEEIERLAGGTLRPSRSVPTLDDIRRFGEYGLIAEGLGEAERARAYLAEAVEGLETRRRYLRRENLRRALGGQRTVVGLYTERARLLAAHGDWEQAYVVAEMTRARALAESLGGARAVTEQFKAADVYRRHAEQAAVVERLTTQLALAREASADPAHVAAVARQLDAATAELDAREEALSRAAPEWRELSAPRSEMLSVAQVAERLPPGTLLLAYLFAEKHLLSWAVTSEGLVGHALSGEFDGQPFLGRPFAARTRAWVGTVSRRGRGDSEGVTLSPTFEAALAEALLGPHDAAVAAAEHLLIVPFADFNTFPFQALPWRGRALGLQKPVSYLPAASLLQYFRPPEPLAGDVLVVGDPEAMSFTDDVTGRVLSLSPLPGARLEAETVAAIHGARPLVGAQATERAVREALGRAPRLIHFATHGFLHEAAPLASGVALANGEAITADELMGCDLKGAVVVFSACDTGLGRLQGSELVGLARGLLHAGARAAVVSLWPVDDVATAMLMEYFHAELRAQGSPARALWRAQLRLHGATASDVAPYSKSVADAYADSFAAFAASGRAAEAERVEERLSEVRLGARRGRRFPDRRPFTAPAFWAAFQVIGDWR
ncbi:MAG TPA: CHAT domain-containing protein, partial [Pyrinomonadaceae bacterium]|nr:CHAT domain-containing protein [Pyrinomonadaceae bacterium]